jgi:hypothetical protein
MKKIFVVFAIIFWLSPPEGHAQSGIFSDMGINFSTGVTSFYGDISDYDDDIIKKYTIESGTAYSFKLNKAIIDNFSISAQVLSGNLKGVKVRPAVKYEFTTKLLEYNFAFNYNLTRAISGNDSPFGFYIYAGMGQFFFHSSSSSYVKHENDEYILKGVLEENTFKKKKPEFVYFFGGFVEYNIAKSFGLTLDLGLRQAHNDKLDARYYPHPDDGKKLTWDYYTHTSFGLSYYFGSGQKRGRHWSNTGGKRGIILSGRSRR